MSTPESGLTIAGKYRLERPLASGGMGTVWLAQHCDLGVTVAVKFMAPALIASSDARARFEREAKAAAHLDSLHVVQVLDCGVDDGTPYMAMELLKGEDLAARLAREGRLSPAATAVILTQVCRALRKAHEMHLVHRDLKPANIFIALKDDDEIVKVLDFGIAKAVGPGLAGPATQTGALIGSVHYMSPEQARRSKDVDHRSDLWSLAVIAFRALTGKLPFAGTEIGDVLVKICAEPVPVPSTIAPDLSPRMDAFFARALARAPEERFQSAKEMATAFLAATQSTSGLDLSKAQLSVPSSDGVPLGAAGSTSELHISPSCAATLELPSDSKTQPFPAPAAGPQEVSLAPSQQTLNPQRTRIQKRRWSFLAGAALVLPALAAWVYLELVQRAPPRSSSPSEVSVWPPTASALSTSPSLPPSPPGPASAEATPVPTHGATASAAPTTLPSLPTANAATLPSSTPKGSKRPPPIIATATPPGTPTQPARSSSTPATASAGERPIPLP